MTRSLQGPGRDNETDPFASLVRDIADLRRRIDDATAQVVRMAGLRAEPDLLRVLGSLVVEGDLAVPNGSITNDALANPVEFADDFANVDSFTTSTTATTLASFTLAIPSGFTRAIVQAASMIFVYNGTATFSYLHNRICIDEPDATTSCSRNMEVRLPNGQSASFAMIDSFGFSGLTSGVLTVRQVVSTESVAISHATNGATVSAVATFLR